MVEHFSMYDSQKEKTDLLWAWMKTRPSGVSLVVPSRIVLRTAPDWFEWTALVKDRRYDLDTDALLRALLIVAVAPKFPQDKDIMRAAEYAVYAVENTRLNVVDSKLEVGEIDRNSVLGAVHAVEKAARLVAQPKKNRSSQIIEIARGANNHELLFFTDFWNILVEELELIDRGVEVDGTPLWPDENPLVVEWQTTRLRWQQPNSPYAFWLRWYEAALQGNHLDLDLEHDIALIPDEDWQKGPEHIAGLIADLEKKHAERRDVPFLDDDLAQLPVAPKTKVQAVQTAIALNHEALRPTFDAIEGYIALEINRLQSVNYETDKEAEECRRFIRLLTTLYTAIQRMRANIPQDGIVTLQQASDIEKLSRLYMRKFSELPRSKADEVIEGAWATAKGALQVSLIGASSSALMAGFGLPVMAAAAVSTMVFSPKLVPDVIKAGIELAKSQAKP